MSQESTSDIDAPEASAASPLPDPPRPLDARARRRAWSEPRVRSLWLAATALLLVAAYFLASRYWLWRQGAQLVEHGLRVDAVVRETATENVPEKKQPPGSIVRLEYTVDGKAYKAEGTLVGRTEWIVVGEPVPVRVDPKDPSRWTGMTQVPPVGPSLVPGLVLLPVVLIFALAALWARARLLRLWRNGQAVEALVLDSRQTALAPQSRVVRCTPADPADRRVMNVYVPPALAGVREGDALWVLAPEGRSSPAVVAAWFE